MFSSKTPKTKREFSSIRVSLASPEAILDASYGEVTKPETINYRSFKPERDGLFCEKIFGPAKDWECHCGKYKRIRYKGIICDRCGVEVTEKKVRRERIGHIALSVPVAHIWYFRSMPNKIGNLLGIKTKDLDKIIYYEAYIVVQAGSAVQFGVQDFQLLNEDEYFDLLYQLPDDNSYLDDDDPNKFIAKIGGEAVEYLLRHIDLDGLYYALKEQIATETSQQRKQDALKRLRVVQAFREANKTKENKPEWMVMRVIPVIPPELRPLVPLEGGRFATSDLNDLYRRVIIRNNRLKRLIEIKAPEVILRNEKRMLQEAVDSLFDNSRKANAVRSDSNRALKSLSDMLKGKQGRFRQNLLGKRVDYSGRSVIVVGPELQLHECGLPKEMAVELFKPFVIRKLIERGIVKTVKSAKKVVDRRTADVWDILEKAIEGHPVLLNRAPTLHRLGIQAFQPKLIEGKAIQLHPLVCTAFNADFDGDQMAVHVPLSHDACLEAMTLMLSAHNILSPASGSPITVPSQDMVLGVYYMTKMRKGAKGEGAMFASIEEVQQALDHQAVDLHAAIKVRLKNGETVETTVGRALFNKIVPHEMGFMNEVLTKKNMRGIIERIFNTVGYAKTAKFLDDLKNTGFEQAFKGGLSFSIFDIIIPQAKMDLIDGAHAEVEEIEGQYAMGFITENERHNKVIDVWTRVNNKVADVLYEELKKDKDGFNAIYMMADSGARGSKDQIRQVGGMRGLMAKPKKDLSGGGGDVIENPILSNFREGLSVLEYFISTHGARKGLADTALKTADAGYLTRRLVDVAQDVTINEVDCGTLRGIPMTALIQNDEVAEPLHERIVGRVPVADVIHPESGEVMVSANSLISPKTAKAIEKAGIDTVEIRSLLTCETKQGVCAHCYGQNLSTGRMVEVGEAVGVIAAQSVGEPGTQLTLRTFHIGGAASRISAESSMSARHNGTIRFNNLRTVKYTNSFGETDLVVMSRTGEVVIEDASGRVLSANVVPYGSTLQVKEGQEINKADVIAIWDPYNSVILAESAGAVSFQDIIDDVTVKAEFDDQTGRADKVVIESRERGLSPAVMITDAKGKVREYTIPLRARIQLEEGEEVKAGSVLAKIPRQASKTSDITGGLPRVTELFEARQMADAAVVSEIDGTVQFGEKKRGYQEVYVTALDGVTVKTYQVPLTKHLVVGENDYVRSGDPLSDGQISPQDILRIKGAYAVQSYVVNEIQEVYRLQGVKINDKHIEAIVRQMMQKVSVLQSGDTDFLEGDLVDKFHFESVNDELFDKFMVLDGGDSFLQKGQIIDRKQLRDVSAEAKRNGVREPEVREAVAAVAEPVLLGITQASLVTDSFISAASFQETTKVLTLAAINARIDHLKGLKENVIVGHLVPAGTGMRPYRNLKVGNRYEVAEEVAVQEVVKVPAIIEKNIETDENGMPKMIA